LVRRMRIAHVRLLLTTPLATVGAVVPPLAGGVAQADRRIRLRAKPLITGTTVKLKPRSTPTDANTRITKIAWDLDGDRKVETRTPTGATAVTVPAPAPGSWTVTVRLVGSVTEAGTEIHILSVGAPKSAQVLVRCLGRGCPIRQVKVVGRGPVTFGALKRLMPAGRVLEMLLHRSDSTGKYTGYKLRRNRRPHWADGCLWPDTTRMARCPGA
jgi:hypothetical protein